MDIPPPSKNQKQSSAGSSGSRPNDTNPNPQSGEPSDNQYPTDFRRYFIPKTIHYSGDVLKPISTVGLSYPVFERKRRDVAVKQVYCGFDVPAPPPELPAHPNILKPHCYFIGDDFFDAKTAWTVMPILSGGSVQSVMYHSYPGGIPDQFVWVILRDVLRALAHIHAHHHVHGNIKAGNILLDSNCVKLADNVAMGTFPEGDKYWAAPKPAEGIDDFSFGVMSDIFCFGVTALEIYYARPPVTQLPRREDQLRSITERFQVLHPNFLNMDSDKNGMSDPFLEMVKDCLKCPGRGMVTAQGLLDKYFDPDSNILLRDEAKLRDLLERVPSLDERQEINTKKWMKRDPWPWMPSSELKIIKWEFKETLLKFHPIFEEIDPQSQRQRQRVRDLLLGYSVERRFIEAGEDEEEDSGEWEDEDYLALELDQDEEDGETGEEEDSSEEEDGETGEEEEDGNEEGEEEQESQGSCEGEDGETGEEEEDGETEEEEEEGDGEEEEEDGETEEEEEDGNEEGEEEQESQDSSEEEEGDGEDDSGDDSGDN